MTTVNTPEQITRIVMVSPETSINWDAYCPDAEQVQDIAIRAIEADRTQRGLIELVAEALDERNAGTAAQLVRDTDPDDDLWNNYLGPMLDSLQHDYTRMAEEINDEDA